MAINLAFATGSAVTVSTSDISAINGNTSIATDTNVGFYSLFVDVGNIASGDEFEVAVLEKCIAGGTQRRVPLARLTYPQPDLLWISPALPLGIGWDFALKKLAGTDRAFTWSVRRVS